MSLEPNEYMFTKILSFSLITSIVLLTACGKQAEEADTTSTPSIPDAPDAAIQTILTEFGKGDAGILWDAMPASYQSDVDTLAQLAGSKLDPEIYNKTFVLVDQLASVLSKQQGFIVGSMEAKSDDTPESAAKIEELKQALPELVQVIQTLTQSDIASVEGLQQFSGEKFADTTIASLMSQFKKLSEVSDEGFTMEDLGKIEITTVESDELTATLSMVAPGEAPQVESFTKVEGRWVPTELASQWATQITEAKAQLEAITPESIAAQKPQIMGALTMVEGVLTQINAAETQAQFDQAVQGAMMPLFGLMMMMQQPAAPVAPTPSAVPSAPAAP